VSRYNHSVLASSKFSVGTAVGISNAQNDSSFATLCVSIICLWYFYFEISINNDTDNENALEALIFVLDVSFEFMSSNNVALTAESKTVDLIEGLLKLLLEFDTKVTE
jgi:hypothetical protein